MRYSTGPILLIIATASLIASSAPSAGSDNSSTPWDKQGLVIAHESLDPVMEPLARSALLLDRIMGRHQKAAAGVSWDGHELVVGLVGDPDQDSSDASALKAELLASGLPLPVRLRPAQHSTANVEAQAQRVIALTKTWSHDGLRGFSYVWPDEIAGRVVIGVDRRFESEWLQRMKEVPIGDVPVVVRGEESSGITFQSRDDDAAPWSGGIRFA